MCWISKNKPILRIAEEDIPVKKVLRVVKDVHHFWEKHFYSPCFNVYEWTPGIIHEEEIGKVIDTPFSDYVICEGLHSCANITLHKGQAYSSRPMFIVYVNEHIFNAFIPKGSQYYLNEYGEYVSNQLCISIETETTTCV